MPVLLDSGVRGGADAFKALALGASAVLIGRSYVYGLAVAGEAGVKEVLDNLRAELDLTMALAGCGSLAEVGPETLERVGYGRPGRRAGAGRGAAGRLRREARAARRRR